MVSCAGEAKEEAKQEEVAEVKYSSYGEEINSDGAISYAEMMTSLAANDTVEVKLAGEIDRTCHRWHGERLGQVPAHSCPASTPILLPRPIDSDRVRCPAVPE